MVSADEPLVSAVIPAYNAAAFIERSIEAALRQTYRNIEVIVVDDGSSDETAKIVRERFPQVRLILNEHGGRATAATKGVGESGGRYIAFLDADDEWAPGKIERQVQVMAEHPGLAVLLCQPWFMPPGGEPTLRHGKWRIRTDGVLKTVTIGHWFLGSGTPWRVTSPSGWLVQKKVYEDLGGFADCWPSDDWEFLMRATGRGHSVAVLCEPLFYYHLTEGSGSRPKHKGPALLRVGPEILASYDPRGEGWRADLLTEGEYCRRMERVWLGCARHCWRRGHREEVAAIYARAEEAARRQGRWHHRLFRAWLVGQRAYGFVRSFRLRAR